MGGLSIGSVDRGISKTGAEDFKQKIHREAIDETKTALGKIDGIRNAIQAGWQGKSQENFMVNLQTQVETCQKALDELGVALDNQLDNIVNAWIAQDNEMVKIEE